MGFCSARLSCIRDSLVKHVISPILIVRLVTGLVEMIYIMLYEEESKGLDGPRRYLQDDPRAVT